MNNKIISNIWCYNWYYVNNVLFNKVLWNYFKNIRINKNIKINEIIKLLNISEVSYYMKEIWFRRYNLIEFFILLDFFCLDYNNFIEDLVNNLLIEKEK